MSKIFTWAPKMMRKMVTGTIWIFYPSSTNWCFISYQKWVQSWKRLFQIHLTLSKHSRVIWNTKLRMTLKKKSLISIGNEKSQANWWIRYVQSQDNGEEGLHIPCVPIVFLVRELVSCECYILGIQNNTYITPIFIRAVCRFILALYHHSYLRCQSP